MRRQRIDSLIRRAGLAALAGSIALSGGCLTGPEFREVAGPAVQQGVSQILNGLLDGLFAAIEPEPDSADDDMGP